MNIASKIKVFYRVRDWYHLLGLILLGLIFVKGRQVSYQDFFLTMAIGFCYLAHGYSFNNLCDKPPVRWSSAECLAVFLPFAIAALLIFTNCPFLAFPFLLAVALNILYSYPAIEWRKITILSVGINAYLFGFLFLLGASVAEKGYAASILWMTLYFALFFVPAQLLHELAHAKQDKRLSDISEMNKNYLSGLAGSIAFLAAFSFYIYARLSLNRGFLIASLLWLPFLLLLQKTKIWRDFSVSRAEKARFSFRITGGIFGLVYLLSFWQG